MTSRTQVAEYVAEKLTTGRRDAIRQAAAWLVDKKRSREVHYLAGDVARVLETKGYTLARVTTARTISHQASEDIRSYVARQTGARHVELDAAVDEAVVGGVRIETPDQELDATVTHKLAKFVEGVSQ